MFVGNEEKSKSQEKLKYPRDTNGCSGGEKKRRRGEEEREREKSWGGEEKKRREEKKTASKSAGKNQEAPGSLGQSREREGLAGD